MSDPNVTPPQGAGHSARIYVLKPFTSPQNSPTMNPGPGRSGPPGPPASALIYQKSNSGAENSPSVQKPDVKPGFAEAPKTMPSRLPKKGFSIEKRIQWMAEKYGRDCLGFQTLTVRENLTDGRELNRRFKSLTRHVFLRLYHDWLRVYERQKRGAWHIHVVAALKIDIRTGCDVEALDALLKAKQAGKVSLGAYYSGLRRYTSKNLRTIWKEYRRLCGLKEFRAKRESKGKRYYKFDASHMLPVISSPKALAAYVGGYIKKGFASRKPEDKGMRLVGCSKEVGKACSERFTWAKGGGSLWRLKLKILAGMLGFKSSDDFAGKLGSKWAYHLRPTVHMLVLPYYADMKQARADGWDLVNVVDGSPWPWPDLELPKAQVQEAQAKAFVAATELLARRTGRRPDKPERRQRVATHKEPENSRNLEQREFAGLDTPRIWAD
jgi:hypothetical protein